ncbi:NAD(P)/FAD-dependent oxidoreductase [Pseudomonas sp. BGr12]|uniref:flavin-dependent monooxygenase QhpG n=1 Tax=unclassified Pseudomonas TaxID=196821 RepID=UPI001786D722|nr:MULTISPECIES: tryptophan 7-halogenase [unclassified Pseudomonas]MBD9503822.1 tryptophan 7-halogenase [Pseudomonas sp. PDM17]MBD9579615.1 tryptophan 7-halogenase [Pseudomonas sp. PDM23]MBD9674868.1 tryptophan 7-halogenase [Pseudomonas sp. PDM21]MDL2429560.1 tryptophan 7-halogenase [Pseudomonas sp. BJa5]
MSDLPILILGAGPAGAAVALGLRRLGHPVTVISEWRRFAAVEGVSQRVLEGLRNSGLKRALECAAPPSQRRVQWNGVESAQNIECVLDRPRFDAGLREDLKQAGVGLIEAQVLTVAEQASGWRIKLEGGREVQGAFLVEARGRQAPLSQKGAKARRGPETLSLLNRWQGGPGPLATAVESLADGWAWMARLEDGRCYWQLTLDVASSQLPPREQLLDYCRERRNASTLVRQFFGDAAEHELDLHARSSTAILCLEACGDNWIRVGDAAMAVDPLSGNGIFQSLSSALQAPLVINTLLRAPERAALARRFHQQRVEQLFLRFARVGRDFYASETRWADQPFWQARRAWPDEQPSHVPADFASLRIERAPVLKGEFVDEAEVVVSADQPLGIWHLDGLELAPWLRRLRAEPEAQVLADLPVAQRRAFQGWLLAQGYHPRS